MAAKFAGGTLFVREIPWDEARQELQQQNAEGFVSVFDGETFQGWLGPVEEYEIRDSALVCKPGRGGTIYTEQEYGDFAVRLEFQLPPEETTDWPFAIPDKATPLTWACASCRFSIRSILEYAQLDDRQYHGSAYGMVPAARGYLRPTGEWNFQEVTVVGSRIRVELNGYKILDADLAEVDDFMGGHPHPGKDRRQGHFGFAGHSDPVQFRKISIKRLD